MRIIEFDRDHYNFEEMIRHFIGCGDLTQLEVDLEGVEDPEGKNSIYKNMEQTSAYERLYRKLDSPEGNKFYVLFEEFIEKVVRPLYDESIFYQKKPTHRIHFKNGSGASRFHRDTDYGHSRAEVNYSVPQTPMFGTNSIWIESEEEKADYKPIEMKVGQFTEFKGAYLKHGAQNNETQQTRVSFDFRVIPQSQAPDIFTDKSSWEESDKDNTLFKNAHDFALCE